MDLGLRSCSSSWGLRANPGLNQDPTCRTLLLWRGTPLQQVAAPLRNAWLRFHENDLCLDVDAVFVFQPNGVEIWCRAKDEGSLQELNALLAPLRSSYRIDLYATYSDREKKPWAREDDDPPPSLWNNAELRNYFRDPGDTRWGVVDDSVSNVDSRSRPGPGDEAAHEALQRSNLRVDAKNGPACQGPALTGRSRLR